MVCGRRRRASSVVQAAPGDAALEVIARAGMGFSVVHLPSSHPRSCKQPCFCAVRKTSKLHVDKVSLVSLSGINKHMSPTRQRQAPWAFR